MKKFDAISCLGKLHLLVLLLSFLLLNVASFSAHADSFEDLLKATKLDDANTVKSLLVRGVDPNTVDAQGRPILHIALLENSAKVAKLLVETKGTNFNLLTPKGENPLMMAAFRGRLDLVKRMIGLGAEVNKAGWTPLHYAATNGHVEIVALLLDKHAYIDAASPNKTTPLMLAARAGHTNVVSAMLTAGADASLQNDLGMDAIEFALQGQQKAIAEMLAAHMRKGSSTGR